MSNSADSDLRSLTGYLLRRATGATMPGVNQVLGRFGLRRGTYSSLVVIIKNTGLNQVQLADSLAIDRPNLVAIVDELEEMKLVVRQKSSKDRRSYQLLPTPKGIELEARVTAALHEFDNYLTKDLSKSEIAALQRALQIVEKNAAQMESLNDLKVSSA